MTRISPKIIKASIKPGSVYYFHAEEFKSPDRHFFVVVNLDPQTDEIIILACASSQIEKTKLRRQNCAQKTLLIITPEQYCGFRCKSIFDCNRIITRSIAHIIKIYANNELSVEPEMDMKLVEMLREGLLASRLIEPFIKEMLQE